MTLKPTVAGYLKFAALYGSLFALIGCLVSLVVSGPTTALIAFTMAYAIAVLFFGIVVAMGAYQLHLSAVGLAYRGAMGEPAVTPWADIRSIDTHKQFGREIWVKVQPRTGRSEPWVLAGFLYGMKAPELRDLLASYLRSEPDDRADALAPAHPFEGSLEAVEPD